MNIKGFIFLICTIFILVLTINYSVNTNHFLVTRKAIGSYSENLHLRDNFIALDNTVVYLRAIYESEEPDLEVWIEEGNEVIYKLPNDSEKVLKHLKLSKGMYTLVIRGKGGEDSKFNTLFGYYTDKIQFIDEETEEIS